MCYSKDVKVCRVVRETFAYTKKRAGGVKMATSSITDNIVISDPKQAEAFADAVEEAAKHPLRPQNSGIRIITDRKEFVRLMKRRKELHG